MADKAQEQVALGKQEASAWLAVFEDKLSEIERVMASMKA